MPLRFLLCKFCVRGHVVVLACIHKTIEMDPEFDFQVTSKILVVNFFSI